MTSMVSQSDGKFGLNEYDLQVRNAQVENEGDNHENRSHRRQWTYRIKAGEQAS